MSSERPGVTGFSNARVGTGYALGAQRRRWGAPIVGLVTLLAIELGCGGPDGGSQPRPDPGAAVVSIRAVGCRPFASLGTGTVVGDDLVLTAAHPVAGETTITVTTSDGRTLGAEIAAIDTVNDGAVLRVADLAGLAIEPLDLTIESEPGAATVLIVEGERPVELVRRVDIATSDIYLEGEHHRQGLELRGLIEPGDSGAAVLDSDGRIVGVAFASSRQTADRGWAVRSEEFLPLIESARLGRPVAGAECSR